MAKAFYKHKPLLDEQMPLRTAFPRLNERFNVKHVAMDLNKGGTKDPAVYDLAVELGRIVITQNDRHFAPLVGTQDDRGIIGIPPHWQPEQIDSKLTALLMRHGPSYFNGRLIRLGAEEP
jgi:hypothetical protein